MIIIIDLKRFSYVNNSEVVKLCSPVYFTDYMDVSKLAAEESKVL